MKTKNNMQVVESWSRGNTLVDGDYGVGLVANNFKIGINNLDNHSKTNFKKEKNVEEIEYIGIDELCDFPKQAEIYGAPEVEPEFVASVKDLGVLTPLTVARIVDGKYRIISGHRRRRAAEEAGLDEVPCIVKEYESGEMMELEFLAANMQREKTESMRVKEFFYYKQILCQIGKVRKSKGIYVDTIFENEHFWRILRSNGLEKYAEPGKPQNSIEILKGITNYSEYEQKAINVLYGENWLQDVYDELRRKFVAESTIEQIGKNYYAVRDRYEAEEISLNEAVKSIKDMIAEVHKTLDKKTEKKAKPEKLKAEKAKPEKQKLTLAVPVVVKREYSETPMKFSESDSVAEFYLRRGEATFGLARNSGMVSGIVAEIKGKVYLLNLEVIANMLKGEL